MKHRKKSLPRHRMADVGEQQIVGAARAYFFSHAFRSVTMDDLAEELGVANLAMGITFSTIAKNQLQAVQMSFFVFLPTTLLSGFMFPFRGMPRWAQMIGEVFPLTHFLRIVRGILLKGNSVIDVNLQLWQIALFAVIVLAIGIKTLD